MLFDVITFSLGGGWGLGGEGLVLHISKLFPKVSCLCLSVVCSLNMLAAFTAFDYQEFMLPPPLVILRLRCSHHWSLKNAQDWACFSKWRIYVSPNDFMICVRKLDLLEPINGNELAYEHLKKTAARLQQVNLNVTQSSSKEYGFTITIKCKLTSLRRKNYCSMNGHTYQVLILWYYFVSEIKWSENKWWICLGQYIIEEKELSTTQIWKLGISCWITI